MTHLLIHSYQNILRIISIDKPYKYYEEFSNIYNTSKNLTTVFLGKGLWINRLSNDIKYKKFKKFKNYLLVEKENRIWEIQQKINNGDSLDFEKWFNDLFIPFVENKINLYVEEDNEDNEDNENNEDNEDNENTTCRKLIYNDYVMNFFHNKVNSMCPGDFNLVVKETNESGDLYYFPKILQINNSNEYYLSNDELFILIVKYINNIVYDTITFDEHKYENDLIVKGDFNNFITINKTILTPEEISYICHYLKLTNIDFGALRFNLLSDEKKDNVAVLGYVDLIKNKNNPKYYIHNDDNCSECDCNNKEISPYNNSFFGLDGTFIDNKNVFEVKESKIHKKYLYKNIITNEIKYYSFIIEYCSEFKMITEINNIKTIIGKALFDSFTKINSNDIKEYDIKDIRSDIEKYIEAYNLILTK